MKIALAQVNPVIGDLKGNSAKIIQIIEQAKKSQADLVVFPELALTGYPPRDLLLQPDFVQASQNVLDSVLQHTVGIGVLLGAITPIPGREKLYNSAFLLEDGRILDRVDKSLLPDYDVFEESRYFEPSPEVHCILFRGHRIGVSICEDIWNDEDFFHIRRYERNVMDELHRQSPDLYINLSASPYHYTKHKVRTDMVAHIAEKYGRPFLYVNQVLPGSQQPP
jgi:NAD+ synthase (glutamine-hydrolysing)